MEKNDIDLQTQVSHQGKTFSVYAKKYVGRDIFNILIDYMLYLKVDGADKPIGQMAVKMGHSDDKPQRYYYISQIFNFTGNHQDKLNGSEQYYNGIGLAFLELAVREAALYNKERIELSSEHNSVIFYNKFGFKIFNHEFTFYESLKALNIPKEKRDHVFNKIMKCRTKWKKDNGYTNAVDREADKTLDFYAHYLKLNNTSEAWEMLSYFPSFKMILPPEILESKKLVYGIQSNLKEGTSNARKPYALWQPVISKPFHKDLPPDPSDSEDEEDNINYKKPAKP